MNQKSPKNDFFGLKLILKTFNDNFKKYSLESVVLSEIVIKSLKWFWCTFDQKISKNFQDFKVWIKSGLKVTFSA